MIWLILIAIAALVWMGYWKWYLPWRDHQEGIERLKMRRSLSHRWTPQPPSGSVVDWRPRSRH